MVAPGVAHHVTQQGVARRTVFYARRDRQVYLKLLAEQARLVGVRVLACSLMSSHIHLVLVSDEERSLALCLHACRPCGAEAFVATWMQRRSAVA